MDEFKVNVDMRLNIVINEEKTNLWFRRTSKEIARFKLFFDSFEDDFLNLRVLT